MITVRQSDTGRYVLVHEPSQTVMVGEDIAATHARMEQHLRDNPSLAQTSPEASSTRGESQRWAWLLGLGVLALLPFLWLTVLHYTLGRLIDELRATPRPAPASSVEQLQAEISALQQALSRVEDEQGRARTGEPRSPARRSPARSAADRSHDETEQDPSEWSTDGDEEPDADDDAAPDEQRDAKDNAQRRRRSALEMVNKLSRQRNEDPNP